MEIFIVIMILALGLVTFCALAVLFFWTWKIAMRQEGILEELKHVGDAQRRVLERFHLLNQKQKALADRLRLEVPPEPGAEPHAKAASASDAATKQDILFLARQGLSAETIAKQLAVPRGEVELILGLDKFEKESTD